MNSNGRYLVGVALFAVLAVAFGVLGTVAPPMVETSPVQPQQEPSESVGHFQNPPTFDSGWVSITDKCGQYFDITHDLATTEVRVDVTGKQNLSGTGGEHQRNFGGSSLLPGWSQRYGGASSDDAYSLVQTRDGGFAIAGSTSSPSTEADFLLIKTDSGGNELWNKTYPGETGDDEAYSVVQTGDGGYTLAGYANSYAGGQDIRLIKTDPNGNLQWDKMYGGADQDLNGDYQPMVQTSDGGYAIAGVTRSFGLDYQAYLVKTHADGTIEWNKTYGGTYSDGANSVVQTTDGGYALVGYFEEFPGVGLCGMVKTDPSGNMQWNKTYGGMYAPLRSVVQSDDGGYALAGHANGDFWLVRTDADGNELWNRTYGGAPYEEPYCMVQTADCGYALAGYTQTMGFPNDVWLVKTDADGNMQWNKTIGGADRDDATGVVQTSDTGYAVIGRTFSYSTFRWNILLVKTNVESGVTWTGTTVDAITLYRGETDPYWNYVRIRIWLIKEPAWIYGDINMDGVVDSKDLYIIGRNYGKTFSLLSLGGMVAIAGIHAVKKRKQTN